MEPIIPGQEGKPRPSGKPAVTSPTPQTEIKLLHVSSGTEFELPPESTSTVGRFDPRTSSTVDIDLEDLDSERSLSRRHARIQVREGRVYLSEMAAANGTFVRRRRIHSGEEVEAHDGDLLKFGLVELRLNIRTVH
jgi:pSer/pThr/pTyr-binding forkhead associated (FHA) protein